MLRRFRLILQCGESMTGQSPYEIQRVFTWQWAEFSVWPNCGALPPKFTIFYNTVGDTVIAAERMNLLVYQQPICSPLEISDVCCDGQNTCCQPSKVFRQATQLASNPGLETCKASWLVQPAILDSRRSARQGKIRKRG